MNSHVHATKTLREFLDEFDLRTRTRGLFYSKRGSVLSVTINEERDSIKAEVEGQQIYEVTLNWNEEEDAWEGDCTCPVGYLCKHQVAVIESLLHEKKPPPKARVEEFPKAFEQRLGRKLTRPERDLSAKLQRLYTILMRRHSIPSLWDLQSIDSSWRIPSGLLPELWQPIPESPWEFWTRLAYGLKQQGASIPSVLDDITNTEQVATAIALQKRQQELEGWQKKIREFVHVASRQRRPMQIDLRLAIEQGKVSLESKRPQDPDFKPANERQVREIARDIAADHLHLLPEAALIWQAWSTRLVDRYYPREALPNSFYESLNQFLCMPLLQDRVVNAAKRPFQRLDEPLRWETVQLENGDYRMRLVHSTGNPPKLSLALPGTPWLYLTETKVCPGPPSWKIGPFATNREEVLPAGAVESSQGIEFLHALGAPLPPALEKKAVIQPLQLQLECDLQKGRAAYESIFISAKASAAGRTEVFSAVGWRVVKKESDGTLNIFSREQCNLLPDLLEELKPTWDHQVDKWRVRLTKKMPEMFANWARTLPPEIELVARGELATLLQNPVTASISLESESTEVDWFDLRVVLQASDAELTREEMKLLLDAKGSPVRIKGKGWRRLEILLSEEEARQFSELGLDASDLSSEPQRLHVLQLAHPAAARILPGEQTALISRRASELKTSVSPAIPPAMRAQLRPYQVDGFHFLAYLVENRFGGILADDMGLGKTVQALTWLEWLRQKTPAGKTPAPTLVVCPKSVMDNWQVEAARFLPDLRVTLWRGADQTAFSAATTETDLMVVNYSQLRGLSDAIKKIHWLAVILDEGQYIKNPSSQTAQVARALKTTHRLILTGTPIENRLLDLWSLMAFAMPGVLGNRSRFAQKFNEKQDPLARLRLSARVRPFLLRRTKQQVAPELPDRIEEDLVCEMEGPQKTLYQAELKHAQSMLLKIGNKKDLDRLRFNFLTSLLRLRQICCHPGLIDSKKRKNGSAKLDALIDLLEPLIEEGHKVLVFSQFVSMLDLIQTEVARRNWPHYVLTGSSENRGDIVQNFQRSPDPAVFLISLKAGGSGLNLTAASYVVLFDPWWNPAVENQAIDRTHRIGQTSKVIAYRLLVRDTVEQKIRNLQQTKTDLAQDILGEEKFAASLTLDDFRFLFEGE